MVHNPNIRKKRSKNSVIFAGIIGAIVAAIAYGAVSGAFSPVGPPVSPTHSTEKIVMHNHAKLTIKIEGKTVTIPANIGIDPKLYKDHSLDTYGMKMPNMPSMPVMAPTHTHDTTGTIHIESTEIRDFTLEDFFNVWGVTFTDSCIMDKCNDGTKTVKMFVDGQPNTEFRNHILNDGEQISIEYG